MEANPTPGPLGPAPGQIASRPMATFTGPSRPSITGPSKGSQAQPAKKTAAGKGKGLLYLSKMKGLGKNGKDTKALARKAKALKNKGLKKKGKK